MLGCLKRILIVGLGKLEVVIVTKMRYRTRKNIQVRFLDEKAQVINKFVLCTSLWYMMDC